MPTDFEYGDIGASKKRGKDGWGEKRIDAARAHMKALVSRFEHSAKIAEKRKHHKHAKVLASLAKTAKSEYDRLTKRDALDGDLGAEDYLSATEELAEMGEALGVELPSRGSGLGWGLAGLALGFLAGCASKIK